MEQKETKTIVISGYYGFGNSGDEAVLQAILTALCEEAELQGFAIKPVVLSVDPPSTEALHGVRAVHRLKPLEIVRTLRESDGLVSGGGSLLQDSTGIRSIPYYLSIIKLAQWLKKPTFIYSQGMGPIRQALYLPLIRTVFNQARYISLRDRESVELLHRIGIQGVPIDVASDPVMGISAPGTTGSREPDAPIVGVSVRMWQGNHQFLDEIAKSLRALMDQRPVRLHFLAFHPPMDRIASEYIIEQLGATYEPRIRLFDAGDDPQEMLERVSGCDLLIGMRLHSLIYAAAYKIPMIGVSYDPKIDHFLRRLQMEASGTTEDVKAEEITEQALRLLDETRAWVSAKKARIEQLKQRSHIPAQQICHYLRIEQRNYL